MATRKYESAARREAAGRTRDAIITAARQLLVRGGGAGGGEPFSIDAIAERAGVARMTVYHQFGSKRALLEALFDDLAVRGLVGKLRPCVAASDASHALDGLIDAFAHFWHTERAVIRRVRALMATDRDFEASINARDERRRELLRGIAGRLGITGRRARDVVDVLHVLTSFETFDALRKGGRTVGETTRIVRELAHRAIR